MWPINLTRYIRPEGARAYLLAASNVEEIWASLQLKDLRTDFLCIGPTLPYSATCGTGIKNTEGFGQ